MGLWVLELKTLEVKGLLYPLRLLKQGPQTGRLKQ